MGNRKDRPGRGSYFERSTSKGVGSRRRPDRERVDELIRLFREKRFEETLARGREFVREWPGLAFGWNLLGATHQALGQAQEAVQAFRRAVELEPGNPDARNNLGNVLRELGQYEESARHHERAVALRPAMMEAYFNLGLARSALGQYHAAAEAFERVIRIHPELPEAHNQLGNALKAGGHSDAAAGAYRRALEIEPDHAGVLSNLALAQAELGAFDDAERSYRRALEIQPRATDVLSNYATFLMHRGRLTEAENCYRRALEVQATSAELHNNLGVLLHKLGRLSEAEAALRRAAELDPDWLSAWHNLGNVVMDAGRLDEAERIHRRAVELAPGSAATHRHLGVTLAVLGMPEEAEAEFRRSLELQPGRGEVYYRLAEVRRFAPGDPDLARMETLLDSGDTAVDDRVYLHYAAGKACADAGDVAASFRHYEAGARLRRDGLDYDVGRDEALFARIAGAFPAGLVEDLMAGGHDSSLPVLVVGMPRSGTTLVETLLAAHPAIHGAGERFDIDRLVTETNRERVADFPAWIAELGPDERRHLGARYVDSLAETSPNASRIVDKMPNNFRYLGLVIGLVPNARVIHVRRNPVDTCLSCFTHLFENEQLFSYDLSELGRFYRAYSALMDHWQQVLPADFLMTVDYEAVVEDSERAVRGMLEHCGLAWDPACLAPPAAGRAVATASLVQVRQPVYRSAVGRWQIYAEYLQPLLNALGDLAPGGSARAGEPHV